MGLSIFILLLAGILLLLKFVRLILKTTNGKDKTENPNEHSLMDLSEKYFQSELDRIFSFLDAYSEMLPNEWYHFFILPKFEHIGDKTYCYLEYKILLGTWWDGLLWKHPDREDYMKSVFAFDSEEKTFTCIGVQIYTSNTRELPYKKVASKLQKYLNNYESKHSEIRFERLSNGAKITKNL